MAEFSPLVTKIVNFIYQKPEIVVSVLQQNGYNIDLKTATFQKIDYLTFYAIQVDKNEKFAQDLDQAMQNDGYENIIPLIIMAVVSLACSLIGSSAAKKAAAKQRELMWNMKMADLASQEAIAYENIRTQAETARIDILSRSLTEYSKSLQEQSTIRLRDTWIYLAMIGLSLGSMYGLYLVTSKD